MITYHNNIKWQVVFLNLVLQIKDIQELNRIHSRSGLKIPSNVR